SAPKTLSLHAALPILLVFARQLLARDLAQRRVHLPHHPVHCPGLAGKRVLEPDRHLASIGHARLPWMRCLPDLHLRRLPLVLARSEEHTSELQSRENL